MIKKKFKENKYLFVSLIIFIILLISFIVVKFSNTDSYYLSSSNMIQNTLLSLLFFFFFNTIYLSSQKSGDTRLIKRILIVALILFPTLHYHFVKNTDNENYNMSLGEEGFNGGHYMTVSPYLISMIQLFKSPKPTSFIKSKFSLDFKYRIDYPFRKLPKSNLYFLQFISVVFNTIIIWFIYRREKQSLNHKS